eukprot:scaffold2849_cov121-Isochrysis_galbana.AAC.4
METYNSPPARAPASVTAMAVLLPLASGREGKGASHNTMCGAGRPRPRQPGPLLLPKPALFSLLSLTAIHILPTTAQPRSTGAATLHTLCASRALTAGTGVVGRGVVS